MNIVVLDAFALNPGDLSWKKIESMGTCKIYDRTPAEVTRERAINAEAIFTNKGIKPAGQSWQ